MVAIILHSDNIVLYIRQSDSSEHKSESHEMSKKASAEVKEEEMTEKEMDEVTTVFRSFETGLREATIEPKVI